MSQVIVDVLQRVQNNAVYIAGKWLKLSRRSKLPKVPLDKLIGTTVKITYTGKWVDEITPVRENVNTEMILSKLDQLQVSIDSLQQKLEELCEFLSKYILEDQHESKESPDRGNHTC